MKGRKTGGRQKGSTNKKTREVIEKAEKEGVMPREYMLNIMRDESADPDRRDDMAKAVAPYLHPRLNATTVRGTGKDGEIPHTMTVKFVRP